MHEVKITKDYLSRLGSYSLEGLIFGKGSSYPNPPATLKLLFEQTTMEWKREHKGCDEIIVAEHVPMVLVESILSLQKQGYTIEVGEFAT